MTIQPGVGAAVFITDRGGKHLLLGKRLRGAFVGSWGTPGGKVEAGETVLEAAQRELQEETGLTVLLSSFESCGYYEHVVGPRDARDALGWITFMFHVRLRWKASDRWSIASLELANCAAWEWFALDALPTPLFHSVADGVAAVKKQFSSTYICDRCDRETAKRLWGPGWMVCPVCGVMAKTLYEKKRMEVEGRK